MEKVNDSIECPFCGSPTVTGIMLTDYIFKAKHHLSKSGLLADDYECIGDFIGEIIDGYPHQRLISFECDSCGRKWTNFDYKYLRSENGTYEFVKVEKKKRSDDE